MFDRLVFTVLNFCLDWADVLCRFVLFVMCISVFDFDLLGVCCCVLVLWWLLT